MFQRLRRSERGSAFVELAVTLPVVLLTTAGIVDFARVFFTSIELSNAARAGAQYGAFNLAQSKGGTNLANIQAAATGSVNISSTAVATRICKCADTAGTSFTATTPANSCDAPETTACPTANTHRVFYIQVTASTTFVPIMRGVPGLPNSIPLSRTATLRVTE